MIRDLLEKPILVFGCGNTLFGDDGFGPAVVERLLSDHQLPATVLAADVGTSIGDLLFDLVLSPDKPRHLFIVDALSRPGAAPGDLMESDIEALPANKSGDFCMHQFPSVNLLRELRDDGGVGIRILGVQISEIPGAVRPGLSPAVERAVSGACQWLLREIETSNHNVTLKP